MVGGLRGFGMWEANLVGTARRRGLWLGRMTLGRLLQGRLTAIRGALHALSVRFRCPQKSKFVRLINTKCVDRTATQFGRCPTRLFLALISNGPALRLRFSRTSGPR